MPLPAITPSSWTGCTNRPSTPSTRLVTITFHQSVVGKLEDPAAEAVDRGQLGLGRVLGNRDRRGSPSSRAAHATPCAMLPALAVTSPLARSDSGAWRIALVAPRILNELIGCSSSSFR